jgi:hypothetical protein
MLHFAVGALLAVAFAMILDLRVADATAISTDLYLSRLCVDCASVTDNTTKTDIDRPISMEKITHNIAVDKYLGEPYWENVDEGLSAEAEAEILTFINAQLELKPSDLGILKVSVEYREENPKNNNCTYLESKLHDPSRVREECGNVEPGSDYLEFFSLLTLTTVSVISSALLAGIWLLHRSFRNRQLRNIIARGKTAANRQIGKGRRRSGAPIRG